MKDRILNAISKTEAGKRLMEDPVFRVVILSVLSMGWNLIYALFNGVLGIIYHSVWFITMFVYYLILGIMRLNVVHLEQKKEKTRSHRTVMMQLGIGMIVLSIVVIGVVTLTISESVTKKYNMIIMIAIATFTFFIVIKAVINLVKAHKKNEPSIIMLRNISCASAVGSILSLERSMLGTFGSATGMFTYTMEGISGLVAFVIILGLGISMLIMARAKPS